MDEMLLPGSRGGGCCGRSRGFHLPAICKLYAVLVLIQSALMVAMATLVLMHDGSIEAARHYAILALFCTAALLIFALDSLLSENVLQFYAGLVMSVLLTLFLGIHVGRSTYGKVWHDHGALLFYVMLAFNIVYIAMAYPVSRAFGYRMYKSVGADTRLQGLFRHFQRFLSLLKMDFVLAVLTVWVLGVFVRVQSYELYIDYSMLIVAVAWSVLGWRAVMEENRSKMRLFLLFSFAEPAYIIYKLVAVYAGAFTLQQLRRQALQFIVVSVIALIVRVLLFVQACRVFSNFHRGLLRVFRSPETGSLNSVHAVPDDL
eukprot:PLAT14990.1.p1 GENE.PLAT14990.1~~PLAT14990.1.p1  ORF type:complete len:327 (+),score=135.47 PLAT14990.1:35-982(+)